MSLLKISEIKHSFENPITIENNSFLPGENGVAKILVGKIPSDARIHINVHIYRSNQAGPTLLVLGGVHGDEINGIEIVSQLIAENAFKNIKVGNIIAIPLLNVFGFNMNSRDLHDGKDVNRSFPGSASGSLASRIARTLTKQILPYVDFAIDLHTGGEARYNYPQIRYTKGDSLSQVMAKIFEAPVSIEQPTIPKSFRRICKEMKIPAVVYEAGESMRIDGFCIKTGKEGIKKVMKELGMVQFNDFDGTITTHEVFKTLWIRTSYAGIFIWSRSSGSFVKKGEPLGVVKDPYGTRINTIFSKYSGFIIGHNNQCIVNQGDPLFHIGLNQNHSEETEDDEDTGE